MTIEIIIAILKALSLALAIIYTFSNVVKAFRGLSISHTQIVLMALGIASFIALMYWFPNFNG